MQTLEARQLKPLYAMWDLFHQSREQLDPKG